MKTQKLPSLISILVLTTITAILWVSLSIYWSIKSSPTPSVPKEVSDPLTPTLNAKVMSEIESKLFFNDSQIPQLNLQAPKSSPTAVPLPTETPIASESAIPVASESGSVTQ